MEKHHDPVAARHSQRPAGRIQAHSVQVAVARRSESICLNRGGWKAVDEYCGNRERRHRRWRRDDSSHCLSQIVAIV